MDPSSIAYYEAQAQAFFDETVGVDMSPLYTRFLAHVPPGGHILDAGCGSGRDARAFRQMGYVVTAFDPSPTLARLASAHCGLPVSVLSVQDVVWQDEFDAVWACASLLHVPRTELSAVLKRLAHALRLGGVLYASFKYGTDERAVNGRRFTDLDERGLLALLEQVPEFSEIEHWVSADRRAEREGERWLNTLWRNR